ncbi:p87 vp80 [Biomphalaria pfeifferi]|uniref:P87 vp80 n=1 Tax=Biomphalaria pfeifferi TaxID=112525 RepID=A0AAD8B7F0_BIOPF|nr:p87 vp80 [Biomphalaria pfeifferi]
MRKQQVWLKKADCGFEYDPDIGYESDKTVDIGFMDVVCEYCQAKRWKCESPGLCCNGGKVLLTSSPELPDLLHGLVHGEHPQNLLERPVQVPRSRKKQQMPSTSLVAETEDVHEDVDKVQEISAPVLKLRNDFERCEMTEWIDKYNVLDRLSFTALACIEDCQSNMALDIEILSDIQIGELIFKENELTLSWDSTPLDGQQINSTYFLKASEPDSANFWNS